MSAPPSGASPIVRIALDALVANAAAHVSPGAVADLRSDAYGHGVALCAHALAASGIRRAVVDGVDRAALAETDVGAVDAVPTLVPEALFGLTGVGGPVMSLVGDVLDVKPLLAGEGVSYGYRHRARLDTRVALVAGGYAHGVVRALGGRASVSIGGHRHPIVGRVAMDVCVVDIGLTEVVRGAPAVFFGDPALGEPSIVAWAEETGMRVTELVTAVGLASERVVV